MSYILFNLITLVICVGIIIAFRQSDKNNRSIEKAKRYGDKIKEDLEAFVNEKNSTLSDLSTELGVQQSKAIATVKRLDELRADFLVQSQTVEERSAAIRDIDRYITESGQTIQKLMDMTALAEKNLMEITREADFVDSLAKSINNARAQLNNLTESIPELKQNFAAEADAKLSEYKSKILDEMGLVINDVENRLASAQRDTGELLEVTAIKLQDLYKEAYNSAADKAGALQEAAFAKLKEETAERVQSYRKEFEETAAEIEAQMDDNLSQTRQIASDFRAEWETQAKDYLAQMQSDFSQTEENISSRINSISERLKDAEDSVSVRSDALSADLSQTEATMRSQFNSLAANFQDNVNSLSKFTDKKLNEFKIQTEERFTKFEKAIENVDSLKEEIEKSQGLIKNEMMAEFSSYVNAAKQSQQNFFNEFTNNSEKIRERMKTIDAGIDDLKAKAYTNVSEKLKMFEDDFFADLAKRSEAINLSFDQWKEDVSANMTLLASENESARKDLEEKYKAELRVRLGQAAEEYKALFAKLDDKVKDVEAGLNSRVAAMDGTVEQYIESFRADINQIKAKASQQLETELASYKDQVREAISNQNAELENTSKGLQEKLLSIREESEAKFETIKKDFEAWKSRTDQQFTDARSFFDEKITNFAGLTENAIKNLDTKYNAQYKDFVAKSGDAFNGIQAKLNSVDTKVAAANKAIDEHAAEITNRFNTEAEKLDEAINKRINDAASEAEQSVQGMNDMILEVRNRLDETQEKVREKIQADADRLNSLIEEIDKKQNDFITQTKVFERADELKEGLEKDIASLKNEVTKFEVYRNAMDDLALQYEKVTHLEEEAKQKVSRFMNERKNIELLEGEFIKLNTLSDSMDKKIIELTAVNDDLQQYQVQIRRLEEGIGDVNTRYERLEKKEAVLNQTLESIDSAFENLKELEADIKQFKTEVSVIPPEMEKIKVTLETLLSNQGRAEAVCEKIESVDSTLEDLNSKMDNLKQARSWLAATETRLKEISGESEAQLKLMADLFKGEKPERNESGSPSLNVQENVLKLSRQGWKNNEIAKALNLSLGEVDLILEYADKR
ncbi:hypothetical protein E4O03_02365 [Treponema sp. OMZ 792]|uniref:SpiroCoCo family coiled-coil protein n=1 Tax=unclassified Treponema TaxID=2638727 RepID=UPI0020A27DD5|nr:MULTISPECIES: hypothetical protein [unclassified Treponema]UTC75595.1 hypothetical protein E4O03_02365 [Treponema sp. OMZ 792]UTC79597.1 hypothetical protein E4O07_02380 [Treponema sp. OMZ 798]